MIMIKDMSDFQVVGVCSIREDNCVVLRVWDSSKTI